MQKQYSIFFVALVTAALLGACGCEPQTVGDPPINPHDTTVVEPEDMIWQGKPYFNITLENAEVEPAQLAIKVRISTDTKQLVL